MIHSAVGTGWPVRPSGACRSDWRYLGSLTFGRESVSDSFREISRFLNVYDF